MTLREVLAKNMRRLRQEQELSQEALADAAGIDRTYVSALERCVYAATVDMLEKLAEVFGVDPTELLKRGRRSSGA